MSSESKRVRGRAGVALRRQRLERDPLCADCLARGIVAAAEEVDHVVPLALGGTDTDDNVRSLCHACHLRRTAEQFGRQAAEFGRDAAGWLRRE